MKPVKPRRTTRRFVMYMDPKTCPACGAPSAKLLGVRYYCDRCYDILTAPTAQVVGDGL